MFLPKGSDRVMRAKMRILLWVADLKEWWDLGQLMHYPSAHCDPTYLVNRTQFDEPYINLEMLPKRNAVVDLKVCVWQQSGWAGGGLHCGKTVTRRVTRSAPVMGA